MTDDGDAEPCSSRSTRTARGPCERRECRCALLAGETRRCLPEAAAGPRSLDAVAPFFGVSRQRIETIQRHALRKLRRLRVLLDAG